MKRCNRERHCCRSQPRFVPRETKCETERRFDQGKVYPQLTGIGGQIMSALCVYEQTNTNQENFSLWRSVDLAECHACVENAGQGFTSTGRTCTIVHNARIGVNSLTTLKQTQSHQTNAIRPSPITAVQLPPTR